MKLSYLPLIIFSITLENGESKEISVCSCLLFFFFSSDLKIGITFAILRILGNKPLENIKSI